MSSVDRKLRKLSRWELRRSTLEQALLTNRPLRYAAYRLRFLSLRVLIKSLLVMVEIWFFFHLSSWQSEYASVLVARHAVALIIALWWGCLEVLRSRVREIADEPAWRESTWRCVSNTVVGWVVTTASAGLGVLALSCTVVGVGIWQLGAWGFAGVYFIACALRLVFELPARTYHSGIYALRRVYLPLWVFVAGDVIDILGVVVLWPHVGPWSFVWAHLAAGAWCVTCTVYFSRQAYRRHGIPSQTKLSSRFGPNLGDLPRMLRFGLANVLRGLDSALVVALLVAGGPTAGTLVTASFFHLVRPMSAAIHDWAGLFYFDYMKIQRHHGALFRRRFERMVRQVALGVAFLGWIVSAVWCVSFYQQSAPWVLCLFLGPFFLVRSYLAIFQVQAFCYQHFSYLLRTGVLVAAGALCVVLWQPDIVTALLILSSSVATALLCFGMPSVTADAAAGGESNRLYSVPRWVALLTGIRTRVRIGCATLRRHDKRDLEHTIGTVIAARLRHGAVCIPTSRRVVWVETDARDEQWTVEELLVATAGTVQSVEFTNMATDGQAALDAAWSSGYFGREKTIDLEPPSRMSRREIKQRFRALFPRGVVLDTDGGGLEIGSQPARHSELRDILRAAASATLAAPSRSEQRSRFDVTCYAPAGEPEFVFLVERRSSRRARTRWRQYLREMNILSSNRSAPPGDG